MEILKKSMIIAAILFQSSWCMCQSMGIFEKAFSESYNQEYLKNYDKAIAELMKVYSEGNYEMDLRLGWLNYLNKNYAVSQSYYQKAINQKTGAIEPKLGIVMPLAFLDDGAKLMQQYNDIIKIHPQNTTANYWVGVMYYNRKDYKNAAKYFEKVVELFPFDYDANHMLAWSFLNLGNSAEAKNNFYTALMIRPNDNSSLDGLSRIK